MAVWVAAYSWHSDESEFHGAGFMDPGILLALVGLPAAAVDGAVVNGGAIGVASVGGCDARVLTGSIPLGGGLVHSLCPAM